jgi:enamine deaminase RidA (YjgF/YER057c/UK114 family)
VKALVGDLDRVARIVKVMAFVNCPAGYEALDTIVDGASGVLVALYGDRGRHARSIVTGGLPSNVSVEIELIAEL